MTNEQFPHWSSDMELRRKLEGPCRKRFQQYLKRPAGSVKLEKTKITGEERKLCAIAIEELQQSRKRVPPNLMRTYSSEGYHRSVDLSSIPIHLPAAHCHQVNQFNDVIHIPIAIGAEMIGWHLIWCDPKRCHGEFISWTNSVLFALEHAMGRKERGQRNVVVAGGTTAKLKSPDGSQTQIFPANDLFGAFEVRNRPWIMREWDVSYKLHPRLFGHEFHSFNVARDSEEAIAHVELEVLIANGLLWLVPELRISSLWKRPGLYERLAALRVRRFNKPEPITRLEILICSNLASLYVRQSDNGKIPLFMFLSFLSTRKHERFSTAFEDWIQTHYTAADCHDLYYTDMERVPDNLPEVEEFIALLRETARILNCNLVPPTILVHEIVCSGVTYGFAAEDTRLKVKVKSRLSIDSDDEASFAQRSRKRKAATLQKVLPEEDTVEERTSEHEPLLIESQENRLQQMTTGEGEGRNSPFTQRNNTDVGTALHAGQVVKALETRDEAAPASPGHIDKKRESGLNISTQEPPAKRQKIESTEEVSSKGKDTTTGTNEEDESDGKDASKRGKYQIALSGQRARRGRARAQLEDCHGKSLYNLILALVLRALRDDWI